VRSAISGNDFISTSIHQYSSTTTLQKADDDNNSTELNEFGHDYTQIGGPIDTYLCTLSETEIHEHIRTRMHHKLKREYEEADKIQEELKQCGVILDRNRMWRADGSNSFPQTQLGRSRPVKSSSNDIKGGGASSVSIGQIRKFSVSSGPYNVHGKGRGHGKRGRQQLNEYGHDYTKVGELDKSICTLTETEINNMIRTRMQCRLNSDYQQADKILKQLNQCGVAISDDTKLWRADGGKYFSNQLNEYGHEYNQIGGAIDKSICKLSEIEINSMIRTRMQCRIKRDYQQADMILKQLEQCGVAISDDAKLWRADGEKSFPLDQMSDNIKSLALSNVKSTNKIPRMMDCRTLDDAIKAIYHNLDRVSPRDISAFWTVVPRLLRHQERGVHLVPQLEAIFLKTADQIHSYGPQDLTTTTLGFAKTIQALQESKRGYGSGSYEEYLHGILITQRDAVFSFIARTAVPILHQFQPRYLKDIAYAYALLEFVPKLEDESNLFDHIAEKSIPLLGKFKPQHISITVWAFEKVKASHPKLYEKVGDHIVMLDHLDDFASQALSNIIWAFAKAGVSHPDLFKKVADHIISLEHLNDFKPQELSNIVWSYAKAKVSHPNLFSKVADHIITRQHLNDFKPQELANIVWAFEKANVSHQDLYKRVGDQVFSLDHLNKFQPQNLSNILIAYAKAEVPHHGLFNKVADHIVSLEHLNDFQPQDLSNTQYSYAKAQVSHLDLFNKVADHIVLLDNLDDYNEQEISNLAWAYHKAGIIRQDLNDKLIGAAAGRKEEFSSRKLNNLYHWTSEEEGMQIKEDDEQSEQDEDQNDSVAAVDDDDNAVVAVEDEINEKKNMEDGDIVDQEEEEEEYPDVSVLSVDQVKDKLRKLGLPANGRNKEQLMSSYSWVRFQHAAKEMEIDDLTLDDDFSWDIVDEEEEDHKE